MASNKMKGYLRNESCFKTEEKIESDEYQSNDVKERKISKDN